jgi:ATP-dependent RNA helicase HelY
VAVISTANRRGDDVRVGALTPDRRYLTLSARDFRFPPRPVGRVELPVPYAPRNPAFRREVAQALSRLRPTQPVTDGHARPGRTVIGSVDEHPAAACPDLRRHLRAAERAERLEKDLRRLERRILGRTESLARQFDRVLRVLEAWGYVDGWSLSDGGDMLARIYHECDLLVAEALRAGVFDDLDATEVAALASTFTYEARRPDGQPEEPWFPSSRLKRRWQELERMATELNQAEEEAGLPLTRRPDPGFVAHAHGWAAGDELSEVIVDEAVSGGDFVRNVKQLIDLVRQLGQMAPDPATAAAGRQAADRLFRGVVAASSVVGT